MMRWDGFSRSTVFAAIAAAAWLPWVAVVRPIAGGWHALVLYAVGLLALYIAGCSAARPRALQAALAAAAAAVLIALGARNVTELAIGLGAVLGIARSGFLYPTAPARAALRELLLIGGGLAFARFLAGATFPSVALAVWGFLLVQSCFFLLGAATHPTDGRHPDPFEEAHRRASALLDAG